MAEIRSCKVSSIHNLHDFSLDLAAFYDQPAHADWQLEPPRSRAARIEIQHAVPRLLLRNVTVARDDHAECCSLRLQIKLRQIVEHVDTEAADLDHLGLMQPARPRAFVDVPANRCDGRNLRQFVENLRSTDIAGVNDVLRNAQRLERLRTKQPVGIGDDADENDISKLFWRF